MTDALDGQAHEYERAESGFLDAVRREAPRSDLASAADAVARAAAEWNRIAYAAFHEARQPDRANLDWLTERTEVLNELWTDIAAAYAD